MNDREYFQTTSLSYQLKAARRELEELKSGEAFRKLREEYEAVIRGQNREMEKLRRERDSLSFTTGILGFT